MSKNLVAIGLLFAASLAIGCEPRTVEDCASDVEAMREVVLDAVDTAASCSSDMDCAIMDVSNACEARCPVAVNFEAIDHVAGRVFDAELSYCVGYGEDCGFTSVTCEERVPACVANRCEMVAR